MSVPIQPSAHLAEPPENAAVLLGNMALAAGLIREAAAKAAASDADTAAKLLGKIGEYSNTIRDTPSDMADALGCGPQTVEAVKVGLARIEAFRACQGLEGSA